MTDEIETPPASGNVELSKKTALVLIGANYLEELRAAGVTMAEKGVVHVANGTIIVTQSVGLAALMQLKAKLEEPGIDDKRLVKLSKVTGYLMGQMGKTVESQAKINPVHQAAGVGAGKGRRRSFAARQVIDIEPADPKPA